MMATLSMPDRGRDRDVVLKTAVRRFKSLSFRRKPAADCEYRVFIAFIASWGEQVYDAGVIENRK